MVLIVDSQGTIRCLYTEDLDLACLGALIIRRASHVEPDPAGGWWVDLAPVHGPKIGPFSCRSEALEAEQCWLEERSLQPSEPL